VTFAALNAPAAVAPGTTPNVATGHSATAASTPGATATTANEGRASEGPGGGIASHARWTTL